MLLLAYLLLAHRLRLFLLLVCLSTASLSMASSSATAVRLSAASSFATAVSLSVASFSPSLQLCAVKPTCQSPVMLWNNLQHACLYVGKEAHEWRPQTRLRLVYVSSGTALLWAVDVSAGFHCGCIQWVELIPYTLLNTEFMIYFMVIHCHCFSFLRGHNPEAEQCY